jgi:hypothetical protein
MGILSHSQHGKAAISYVWSTPTLMLPSRCEGPGVAILAWPMAGVPAMFLVLDVMVSTGGETEFRNDEAEKCATACDWRLSALGDGEWCEGFCGVRWGSSGATVSPHLVSSRLRKTLITEKKFEFLHP